MILDAIKDFLIEKVIIAGITWIIGLLNPASAFIKACKAIYDIVMFFVERGARSWTLVNAVIDSMARSPRARSARRPLVENALARPFRWRSASSPACWAWAASASRSARSIATVQAPVNKAIDWVIHQAVKLVKAAGNSSVVSSGEKEERRAQETYRP